MMKTRKTHTMTLWNDSRAVEFPVYGWLSPSGYVWKKTPITPVGLQGEYDKKVLVRASNAALDDDAKSALNREFGW